MRVKRNERTLREIYLPAFEAAVREAHVGAIMDSYNFLNGVHMTQNGHLNTEIAKQEWGFTGIVMSDWDATYDGVAATPGVALEAMQAAKRHGAIVSYDLNYRESLWKAVGGKKQAQAVNRELAPLVDVMIGNEEDFSAALGFEVEGMDENFTEFRIEAFRKMI